jgi:hypothetical protein
MTKHKTFEELYKSLLQFIQNYHHIPSSSSSDKLEKRLGNWCYQLRKTYRLNKLSEEKIILLQKIDIWFWNKQEFNKNKCFKELNLLNFGKSSLSKKTKNWIKNNKISTDSCITIQNNKIVISLK